MRTRSQPWLLRDDKRPYKTARTCSEFRAQAGRARRRWKTDAITSNKRVRSQVTNVDRLRYKRYPDGLGTAKERTVDFRY